MSVTYEVVNTLRANANSHEPIILCAAFKPGQGVKAMGIGYEKEKSPTLSSLTPAVLTITDEDTSNPRG